jgi:hypothetical protein
MSYKGLAGMVDNERRYSGSFDKGISLGQTWVGSTIQPLPKYYKNFAVVSTDYENYAILYQCTYRTVMYNKDVITVITRQPDFSQLESGTDEKIRSEFERIFGQQEDKSI